MRGIDEIKAMNAAKEEQNSIRENADGTRGVRIREINRVQIKEGDILVLRFQEAISQRDRDLIEKAIDAAVLGPIGLQGKVKTLVLDKGADICVLEKQLPGGKYKLEADPDV